MYIKKSGGKDKYFINPNDGKVFNAISGTEIFGPVDKILGKVDDSSIGLDFYYAESNGVSIIIDEFGNILRGENGRIAIAITSGHIIEKEVVALDEDNY